MVVAQGNAVEAIDLVIALRHDVVVVRGGGGQALKQSCRRAAGDGRSGQRVVIQNGFVGRVGSQQLGAVVDRRHLTRSHARGGLAERLVGEKEKQLVLFDGSAEGAAKLIDV